MQFVAEVYFLASNPQGDITYIYDIDGNRVVTYNYDAWGNILSISGTKASTIGRYNPFRYRGYYYDNETGLYYLNSRYYDPSSGRFISADGEIASIGSDILGNNLFSYCMNNPVNRSDQDGNWSIWATIGVAVGATLCIAAITVLTCGVGTGTLVGAIAVGAAKGVLIGASVGTVVGAGIGYAVTGTLEGALEGAAIGFGVGSFVGGVAGGTASAASFSASSANVSSQLKDALKILDKSGIKPGQSSISQSRVMEIFNSYDPMKAHTSYTSINGSLYVSEGHHTLIANVMKYGRICSGVNMGGIVSDPAILVGVTWSTLKILP